MRIQREINSEKFETLLSWLDQNREAAALKYEMIRARLVKIFVCRGCADADTLADETIDRVTVKITEITKGFTGNSPELYFYGVARMVFHESLRQEKRIRRLSNLSNGDFTKEQSLRGQCMDECLQKLPPDEEEILVKYYQENKTEKKQFRLTLAKQFDISPNALRVKIYRLRQILQACIKECIAQR